MGIHAIVASYSSNHLIYFAESDMATAALHTRICQPTAKIRITTVKPRFSAVSAYNEPRRRSKFWGGVSVFAVIRASWSGEGEKRTDCGGWHYRSSCSKSFSGVVMGAMPKFSTR